MLLSLWLLLADQAAPVMSCGCSRSAPVCSCGLMNSQTANDVPWVNGSHRVSAGLEESEVHLLTVSALPASLRGSGRKSGGLNGNILSCPVDGLC